MFCHPIPITVAVTQNYADCGETFCSLRRDFLTPLQLSILSITVTFSGQMIKIWTVDRGNYGDAMISRFVETSVRDDDNFRIKNAVVYLS